MNKIDFLSQKRKISSDKLIKEASKELYSHLFLFLGLLGFCVLLYFFGISIVHEWKVMSIFLTILSIVSFMTIFFLSFNHIFNIIFNHEKYVIKILEEEYDDLFK